MVPVFIYTDKLWLSFHFKENDTKVNCHEAIVRFFLVIWPWKEHFKANNGPLV